MTLSGTYDLALGAKTLQSVEVLKLAAGGQYHIALADETIAKDHIFKVQAEAPTYLDASANLDGRLFFKGEGHDTVIGGAGDDIVWLDHGFGADDRIDGGGGTDLVFLQGGGGRFQITPDRIAGVDAVLLVSGDLHWVLTDGVVGPEGFSINSYTQVVDLDARAEKDASISVYGGVYADRFFGGSGSDEFFGRPGDDIVRGGGGADRLEGGADRDIFQYVSVKDSRPETADVITDLEYHDRIDLSRIDADRTLAGNQAFHLVSTFDGHAGELVLTYDAAHDATSLSADVNGDQVADMLIWLWGDHRDFNGVIL